MIYLRFLTWAVLVVNSMIAMGDGTSDIYSSIFEVDLISPRNETYTPEALMPIVFALQNSPLASSLDAYITWDLLEGNNRSSPGSINGGLLELASSDLWSPGLHLVTRFVNTLPYPNGFWTFAWTLHIADCSQNGSGPQDIKFHNDIVFTVSLSGEAPSLEAATSSGTCGIQNANALNVTATGEECGFLGPSPTTNPCAARIDASAASSIWAAATAFACSPLERSANPNVTCPTPSSKSNGIGQYGMIAASTMLTLFTMVTALIYLGNLLFSVLSDQNRSLIIVAEACSSVAPVQFLLGSQGALVQPYKPTTLWAILSWNSVTDEISVPSTMLRPPAIPRAANTVDLCDNMPLETQKIPVSHNPWMI
ncbi:hypothetical protein BO79DRAFT_217265 [Aspergillus costaricaensis CBS 115574]|uniref:Uncharacterized protein n=1 Tax=Aspergillus costaricaensis CBS 115574 TaxID=1448317 RepID=A0ACD1IF15_9EURO|nr:hypothetical protein BO79DRAFT_217265 [Aspergillus costaricaensis CBS 115574]RAK89175.1 hypothetical protein BO79DRAFT_217265 [Aspergillus costaricaensis CBS 115574]